MHRTPATTTRTTVRRLRTRLLVVVAALAVLATATVPAMTASAATAPPPVSTITVTERTAHRITISYVVPAAYYSPGGGGVVRVTRGYTPAATPTSGYAVPVTGRTARTTLAPSLTPNVAYTFAVWVKVGSTYSARRAITVVTRPDVVTDLAGVAGTGSQGWDPHGALVRLSWRNPAGPLKAIRIVRNLEPTTAGGTVVTLSGSATSYVDLDLPDAVCGWPGKATGCSTKPVHYWVIPESTIGGFADRYLRSDVVVGSRTISGTVSGSRHGILAECCTFYGDGNNTIVTDADADPAVDGGRFTVHVPPGIYTVCTYDHQAPRNVNGLCWSTRDGGTRETWYELGGEPAPTIDVRTAISYTGVRL